MDDRRSLSLAEIRQSRGISLEQISHDTKIGVRYLLAIEREDFASLPGGIITTSYLRQYAAAIDYDEAPLLACHVAKRKDPPEPPARAANRRQKAKEWLAIGSAKLAELRFAVRVFWLEIRLAAGLAKMGDNRRSYRIAERGGRNRD